MPTPAASTPSPRPSLRQRLSTFNDWRHRHREAGLTVILVLQAIFIFVISPMAAVHVVGMNTTEVTRFGLAAVAILIVSRSRWVGGWVAACFVVSLVCTLYIRSGAASQVIRQVNIGVILAFDVAVAFTVARAAFTAGHVNLHRIMGAVILYLYIGLIFASLYRLCNLWLTPAFTGLKAVPGTTLGDLTYFSFTTLTTAGFGDIVPAHPFVRSLTNLEAVIGQLYPATFLARLVTLHGEAAHKKEEG